MRDFTHDRHLCKRVKAIGMDVNNVVWSYAEPGWTNNLSFKDIKFPG